MPCGLTQILRKFKKS